MKIQASPFGVDRDTYFMKQALKQAHKAYDADEVPVGAVVVDADGRIIARGYNQVEKRCTQRAHAENIALEKAGKKVGNWRLHGCWLYVTLEPCVMCMEFIRLSRLEGVVFGAHSPLFGYQLDKEVSDRLYKRAVSVIENICAQESIKLLQRFFKQKRNNSERSTGKKGRANKSSSS